MRRRRDIFVRPNSISDIQELVYIAENQKEKIENKEVVIRKKIEELNSYILTLREEFLNFLILNNIDPNYPVLGIVTEDKVVPDTVAEQSFEAVPIEKAMLPNIPNDVFLRTINLLTEKYETLQKEIEEYTDKMLKARLQKAKLELKLEEIIRVTSEYREKIENKKEEYDSLVNNLEMIKYLYQNLLDFKYLFIKTPDSFTSDSYIKFYNNYLNRYSSYYYEKKKIIKNAVDSLNEKYKANIVDKTENGIYLTVFKDISSFFDSYQGDNLPDKYVDAIPLKKDIVKKLDKFSEDLNVIIDNNKQALDFIREVKGIGNSVVDGLISSVLEISKSFATQRKIEHTTFEDVKNSNYTINLSVNQKINTIKNKLQLGVEKLDETFIRSNREFLRKIALTIGFPVEYSYDKSKTLEEHIREKVRLKYGGNIPFCDEEVIINADGSKKFIKKDELDKDKISKKEKSKKQLEKITQIEQDILSI